MSYYRLLPDMCAKDRTHFGSVLHIDNWRLLRPTPDDMEPMCLEVSKRKDGVLYDFHQAGYAGLPIVTKHFVDALATIPEIKTPFRHTTFHEVRVSNDDTCEPLFAMIVEDYINALDTKESAFVIDDGSTHDREELIGTYQSIFKLKIDRAKASNRNIFYLEKAVGFLIVSQLVFDALKDAKVTGVRLLEA